MRCRGADTAHKPLFPAWLGRASARVRAACGCGVEHGARRRTCCRCQATGCRPVPCQPRSSTSMRRRCTRLNRRRHRAQRPRPALIGSSCHWQLDICSLDARIQGARSHLSLLPASRPGPCGAMEQPRHVDARTKELQAPATAIIVASSNDPRADMADERRRASFAPAQLTHLLNGGRDRVERRCAHKGTANCTRQGLRQWRGSGATQRAERGAAVAVAPATGLRCNHTLTR